MPDYSEVLEKLMLINNETQATLFHTRSILNDENGEQIEEAAADLESSEGAEEIDEDAVEIPDFLAGDGIEIYE